MFNEKDCLINLKRIVSEFADDENIKHLSLDEFRSSYNEISENMHCISVSNRLKYKNLLWNFRNLRPEVRSKFQTELFNTWHSIYKKSVRKDPLEDHSEPKKQEPTLSMAPDNIPEVNDPKATPVTADPQHADSEKRKIAAPIEAAEPTHNNDTMEMLSNITSPANLNHRYENDWFDKLLDFFAAIVGCVYGKTRH